MYLSYATVCTPIQVAGLTSLSANHVRHLHQDPTMRVDSLLCTNEVGSSGWVGERGDPWGDSSGINIGLWSK